MSHQIDWPDEQTYGQRVYGAYTALIEETKMPDVPVAALYARVGGDLETFHQWLRAECQAQSLRAHHG